MATTHSRLRVDHGLGLATVRFVKLSAELLMPERDIRSQFGKVSMERLAVMKPYWKVSMAALLMRARDLGKVSPRMERYLWMQMGKAGYRNREPASLDIPKEQPKLLSEIVDFHRNELQYSLAELGRLVHLHPEEAAVNFEIALKPSDSNRNLLVLPVNNSTNAAN